MYEPEGALTPSPACEANMNGRRYSDSHRRPRAPTHCRFRATPGEAMKSSTGSAGIASRCADRCRRAPLASGRKAEIEPSGCR